MKIGIIDIGSNTVNLLIAELGKDNSYKQLHLSKIAVKLVESDFDRNYITESAMERALVAIQAHIHHIKNEYCDRALAFGGVTLRNAINKQEFLDRVYARHNLTIRILDEEQESKFIHSGVRLSGAIKRGEKALIMDIGGGYTEFIACERTKVIWRASYELGVTRLIEKLEPDDPITPQQIEEVRKYLLQTVSEVFDVVKKEKIKVLVGSSGSFDTFSDVLSYRNGSFVADIEKSSLTFDKDQLLELLNQLVSYSISKRRTMQGMAPMRANIIGMSAIFVLLVQEKCNFENIVLSRYSLKEGVLYDTLYPI